MVDIDRLHEKIACMIDDAMGEDNRELANWVLAEAEGLAHEILKVYPTDADACYAVAMTWYHRWLPQSERRNCIYWLRKTRELAPGHRWVPLYLGYQLWDDEQYAEAFSELARVDQDYFATRELHWRNIKTRELMLCCRVRGDFPVVDVQSLNKLVSDYIAAEVVDQPMPIELIKTVSNPIFCARFDVPPHAVAREICRLIEGMGVQKFFRTQLDEFKLRCEIGYTDHPL